MAIYCLACALSIVLFFAYGTTTDTLNDDGINYIYAAHALAEGRPEQAKTYRPEVLFYSQITYISSLSGLDLYPSAQLLSLLWQVLLACGFIAIVRCFDSSLQTQIIALAVLFSMASLNHLRPDIIRGFGFWALQLWALWAGLRFIKSRLWRFALLWLGLSSLAILYRAEGIAYLCLIPAFALLTTIFTGGFSRKKTLQLASLIFLIGAIIWLISLPELKHSPSNTTGLAPIQGFSASDKLQREFSTFKRAADNFDQLKTDIRQLMPTKWAQRSVNDLLIGGFIFHVLLTLIKTSNVPLLALSLYRGKLKPPFLNDPRHKLLAGYIFIGILIGLMSVYNKYFISPRYIMLTAILIGIPITLLLSRSYSRLLTAHQPGTRLWKYALFALPLLTCIYPLTRQDDEKRYIRDAGQWVKSHLRDEQAIYFNQQKVAFYSDNYANDSFKKQYTDIQSLAREGYQYAVLYERSAENDQQPLQQSLKQHRLITFQNNRGRSVNVYKLPVEDSYPTPSHSPPNIAIDSVR